MQCDRIDACVINELFYALYGHCIRHYQHVGGCAIWAIDTMSFSVSYGSSRTGSPLNASPWCITMKRVAVGGRFREHGGGNRTAGAALVLTTIVLSEIFGKLKPTTLAKYPQFRRESKGTNMRIARVG